MVQKIDTSETWDISEFIKIYELHWYSRKCHSSHTDCLHIHISGLSLWIRWWICGILEGSGYLNLSFFLLLLLVNILRWQSQTPSDNSSENLLQRSKIVFVYGYLWKYPEHEDGTQNAWRKHNVELLPIIQCVYNLHCRIYVLSHCHTVLHAQI